MFIKNILSKLLAFEMSDVGDKYLPVSFEKSVISYVACKINICLAAFGIAYEICPRTATNSHCSYLSAQERRVAYTADIEYLFNILQKAFFVLLFGKPTDNAETIIVPPIF